MTSNCFSFRSVSCSNPTFCHKQSSHYFTTLHHPGPSDASQFSFFSGEQFPSPSLSSSDGTPFTSPSQSPRYSRGTPRSGLHSPNRHCALHAPAGNKQHKHANDVRTFYSEEKELHICLFCTSVFLYHVPLIYFL